MHSCFNNFFYPELAKTPLKGDFLKALASRMEGLAEEYSGEPACKGMAVIARNFSILCREQEAQFSLSEIDSVLDKMIAQPFTGVEQFDQACDESVELADPQGVAEAMENATSIIIKNEMSMCIAAQEGRPECFQELYEVHLADMKQKEFDEVLSRLHIQLSSLRDEELESEGRQLQDKVGKDTVEGLIHEQNGITRMPVDTPPTVLSLMKKCLKREGEAVDEMLAGIYDLDMDSKQGKILLQREKDQLIEKLRDEDGITLIDRPYDG